MESGDYRCVDRDEEDTIAGVKGLIGLVGSLKRRGGRSHACILKRVAKFVSDLETLPGGDGIKLRRSARRLDRAWDS